MEWASSFDVFDEKPYQDDETVTVNNKPSHPLVADSIYVSGERITVGDALNVEQRATLEAFRCKVGNDLNTVIDRILAADNLNVTALTHVIEQKLPPVPTDEITFRAREALIGLGVLPGAEMHEAIRAGNCDNLVGIQTAVQVLRDLPFGLTTLPVRAPSAPMVYVPPLEPHTDGWVTSISRACSRFVHRMVRLYARYDRIRERNLALAEKHVRAM